MRRSLQTSPPRKYKMLLLKKTLEQPVKRMRSRLRVLVTQRRLLSLERLKKKAMLTMMKKVKRVEKKKLEKRKKRHVSLMRSKLIVVSSLS